MLAKPSASLTGGAVAILATADPAAKVSASRRLAEIWDAGGLDIGNSAPPPRSARPGRPQLRPPKEMPKRRAFGSPAGRIALLHALAHIELNAIDLAWDIIARFRREPLPRAFFDDWVGVAAEEAVHFELLVQRLGDFGACYGDLPAHDGLWESAAATAGDLLARLAVVPLVRVGDPESAAVLRRIYCDEIHHVAAGVRWFDELCRARTLCAEETFRELVRRYFKGELKPPFNHEARAAAGFPARYYEPVLRGGVPLLRG